MLQKMRECGKLHKLLKVMTALLMLEAWVLSINGCVANESFLVYLMLIMLADFIRKSEWNNLFTLKKCLYASAAAILVTVIFVIGVLKLNISGDIIISHLKFKAIIVFAGYFFMFLLWLQQKMKITGKQLTAMAGGVVLSVFVFHLQHIISACSVAGYVVGIWLMKCFFYQKPKAENDAREKGVTIFLAILFAFFSVAGEGIDSTLMLELLGFQGVAIGFILCMT